MLVDLMLIIGAPAKTTAWIAIFISLAAFITMVTLTAVFRYFVLAGVLIEAFILYSTLGLYRYIQKHQVEQHPLFKKASELSENPALEMFPTDDGSAEPCADPSCFAGRQAHAQV
jgi:membrane protein implicated in regulation of membrane protease activity